MSLSKATLKKSVVINFISDNTAYCLDLENPQENVVKVVDAGCVFLKALNENKVNKKSLLKLLTSTFESIDEASFPQIEEDFNSFVDFLKKNDLLA